MAAGIFGMAALVKITAFATALAILGVASSAQAGILGKPCAAAPQNQWLSVEALQSKVELFVDPTNGQIVGRF